MTKQTRDLEEEGVEASWNGISTRKHDIGLFGFAKTVATLWIGMAPILFGMKMLVVSEIKDQNAHQDEVTQKTYVSRPEFEERMKLIDERGKMNADLLREVKEDVKALRTMREDDERRGRKR